MTSPTLIDELIAEVRLHNPAATSQEVSDGIAAIMSKEILPGVLKNLSLPKFPSYRSIETAEARSIKAKRRPGTDTSIHLDDRRRIIQQIEYVRTRMGWDGSDDFVPKSHAPDSSSLHYIPKIDLPAPRDALRKEKLKEEPDYRKTGQPTEEETVNGTFQKMTRPPGKKDIIALSETAQRKIASEPIFEAVFKNVEVQLRNIIASRKLETEIDVVCKTDVEISSWNKCVLRVHPPPNLDFNERMNISTIFDITIRKAIKDLKENADSNTIEYLQNLNRSLFVHIDL
jgi:hypothetical protein